MNDFKNKLIDLRMKAGDVVKGTIKNLSPEAVAERYRAVDQARADRDAEMIRENFGSEENYRKKLRLDTEDGRDIFTPPYRKVGRGIGKVANGAKSMFDRLVSVRGGNK